jgi:hypothetical protein
VMTPRSRRIIVLAALALFFAVALVAAVVR